MIKDSEKTINTEEIEGENWKDALEEVSSQLPAGIVQRLQNIGEELLEIWRTESDPEEKEERYENVKLELFKYVEIIQQMMEEADSDPIPETLMEFVPQMNEESLDPTSLFLEAIQRLYDFMDFENQDDIEEAQRLIDEATFKIEEIDASPEGVESILEAGILEPY